jgi:hypothetical protein
MSWTQGIQLVEDDDEARSGATAFPASNRRI